MKKIQLILFFSALIYLNGQIVAQEKTFTSINEQVCELFKVDAYLSTHLVIK